MEEFAMAVSEQDKNTGDPAAEQLRKAAADHNETVTAQQAQTPRTPENGSPAKVGEEGGVVVEATGDFVYQAPKDRDPEVGVDGKNPVTPQNPPKKAVIAPGVEQRVVSTNETAVARDGSQGQGGEDKVQTGDKAVTQGAGSK